MYKDKTRSNLPKTGNRNAANVKYHPSKIHKKKEDEWITFAMKMAKVIMIVAIH